MKSFILTVVSLASADARFFRSEDKLGASADFQGAAHEQHKYEGTTFHHGAGNPSSELKTRKHIEEDLKQMLSAKLPGLFADMKTNMDTLSDTGLLFCGAPAPLNAAGVNPLASRYDHDYSDSAVNLDGMIGPYSEAISGDQCGDNKCLPESLVAKLAGLIRAHGYHVKHSDICTAQGQKELGLDKCSISGAFAQRTFSCPREVAPQYEQDEICSTKSQNDCDNNSPDCQWLFSPDGLTGTHHYGCIASYGVLEAQGCVEDRDGGIGFAQPTVGDCQACHSTLPVDIGNGIDEMYPCPDNVRECCPNNGVLWERILPTQNQFLVQRPRGADNMPEDRNICMKFKTECADGGCDTKVAFAAPNIVARTIQYSFANGVGANIPDSVTITGDSEGCAYLRGTVLAINGNKIHERYISKQHNAAEEYWQSQLDDTKALVKTIREKIHNLQGLGGYFYPLEKSKAYQCNADFAAFEQGIDAGGPDDPKCDLAGTDYSSFQGTPHHKSMAQRSTCFCRSFADSGDEFYLTTTQSTGKAFCDANFKEKLPSVYTYCLEHAQLGDTEEWKRTLDQLLFSPEDVPTQLDTWFPGAVDELRTAFENSIQGQGTKCGRVSSADPNTVKFSNKGGNCVPLEGVQDIVYRLEFEFFNADAAVDRKGYGNPTHGWKYADTMCEANLGGEQILSFRQLAYDWQRKNPNNPGKLYLEDDFNTDTIQTTDRKAQFYDDDGNNDYQEFCSVDYAQLLGGGKAYKEGGTEVADPLEFLSRVSGEASFNVEKTRTEKADVKNQQDTLWNKIRQQLTDNTLANTLVIPNTGRTQLTLNNLLNSIGEKVTGHWMAILGHDAEADGFKPICAPKVAVDVIDSTKGIARCEAVKELKVTNAGDVNVDTFAAFNAVNLRKTELSSGTGVYNIKSMAFRNNAKYDAVWNTGSPHTILFKSDKYTAEGTGITVTMEPNAIDAGSRCGLLCDDGYLDSATEYFSERAGIESFVGARAPLCDVDNLAELGDRHCELDRRSYQVAAPRETIYKVTNDKFDGPTKYGFFTTQITRDTKFDCGRSPREFFTREPDNIQNFGLGLERSLNAKYDTKDSYLEPTVTLAEFYLGTDCATLEIGDLSKCPFLEHVYIHTQTDYVTDGPNTAAAASCASKVDFTNAKFGDKLRFVWTDDATATADARTKATIPDKTFIFFGEGSTITDAAGTSVATDGEHCAQESGTTPAARGDQVYLVSGDYVKTRFSKSCPWADKLVLPDSIPRLSDSAILDLETDASIVGNETDADPGFFIGDKPFEIFVGEKLLAAGNTPDIDNYALFIDDSRQARLQRRCPTLTMDRDDGTRKVMKMPRSLYAIGAEEGDQPYLMSTADIVFQPYMNNAYGWVNHGINVPETTEQMTTRTRSIRLEHAYDGVSASRGHRSCFGVVQKQLYLAQGADKTCLDMSDFYECPAPFNWYCDETSVGGDPVNGPWPTEMGQSCETQDALYPNWGLMLQGDFAAKCSDGKPYVFTSSQHNMEVHEKCRKGTGPGTCNQLNGRLAYSGGWQDYRPNQWGYPGRPNTNDWNAFVDSRFKYPYGNSWGFTVAMPTTPAWTTNPISRGGCDKATVQNQLATHFEPHEVSDNGQVEYRWGPEAQFDTQEKCYDGMWQPTVSMDMDFAKRCKPLCTNMQGSMGGGGALQYFRPIPTCAASYPFAQHPCWSGGVPMTNGQSATMYQNNYVFLRPNQPNSGCQSEVRTCTNGVLSSPSGQNYAYASCTDYSSNTCVGSCNTPRL